VPSREPLRLMAVHAHPDDEASKGAATTAKYVDEGVEVMVVTCTGGERGDILNPAMQEIVDQEGIHAVREREMAEAARILKVKHAWLGFEDSGFPEGDPKPPLPPNSFAARPLHELTPALVRHIREFRPQVITTYDENGGYPHPDHIRTHEITMAAVKEAADVGQHQHLGDPHQVSKIYFNHQFSKTRIQTFHQAMLDAGLESPYAEWLENWKDRDDNFRRVTTRVHAADYFPIRDQALLAHATQIDPNGMWFAVPLAMQQELWPTEDFELAWSAIEIDTPEDDLFAGLRSEDRHE
jgi:mycothiol S-conjugate amidase